MKKMTREQFLKLPVGDLFDLDKVNDLFLKSSNLKDYIFDGHDNTVNIKDLGIEIIVPKPEITQENLCKFFLKFDTHPEAQFKTSLALYFSRLVAIVDENKPYINSHGDSFSYCDITDSRWTAENLK